MTSAPASYYLRADTVLVMDEGTGARQILGLDPGAIRAVVVGVVDEVSMGG